MKRLLKSTDTTFLEKFGLSGYHLVELPESRQWIMQYTDDPVVEKRKQFPSLVKKLLKPQTAILIKGQDADLSYDTPNKMRSLYPNTNHEIIFLSLSIDEIYRRCQQKAWWEEGVDTKENLVEWLEEQVSGLSALVDFRISAYDSSDEEYRKVAFAPSIVL